MDLIAVKRGILVFWAVWHAVVWLANACDALKAAGVLPRSWKFASGNWGAIRDALGVYRTPPWLAVAMFGGVLAWQATAAALMWRAALAAATAGAFTDGPLAAAATSAFGTSAALWAALVLADEVLIAYHHEGAHLRILTALLVSLLAIRLLPDGV
ncbi:MAG: hypothetical protein QN183_00990 [Armatimonadota bacterium]|nr:hypothetical protein [Armatimonadota bacterium]MDR7486998.1 hypothetical protein [Armatimonadota bacterium]MDR7531731.1 hypothetical protein [Armatimonadota bacterium]MDR7534925.1 hypothetical protein [Armatimonadota bacterium]